MPPVNLFLQANRYISLAFFFLLFLKLSASETCTLKTNCQCVFRNGSVIDLTSLGHKNTPRWANQISLNDKCNGSCTYFYNPCFSFSIGPSNQPCAKGVAVCQFDKSSNKYYDCGDPDSVNFVLDNNDSVLKMIYSTSSSSGRTTNVTLVCAENAIEPQLSVIGENVLKTYEMTLTTRCACPDLCRTTHLSTGSVLVIIFMIFVALYLVLGIIHSSLTRGAHGWELIPHYEFWADFPLLVRDGCVFVVNGCKPETAYDRI